MIELVGLTDKARARIRTLSGGQQRRLDVALGLIGRPELLFLDEPTTGFDPAARRSFWEVIRALSGGGVTVLLTTHYLVKSARNGVAVITLPFVVLQFISGVYVPFFLVPTWLRDIASAFPLEWMCRGMRSAFVPQAVALEPGHSWQHGQAAVVLLVWIGAGLVLCLTTFRWQNRRDR